MFENIVNCVEIVSQIKKPPTTFRANVFVNLWTDQVEQQFVSVFSMIPSPNLKHILICVIEFGVKEHESFDSGSDF